jgi:hypothetical protein
MIPLVEPAVLYESVAQGLVWLGVIATVGTAAVLALVARPIRTARRNPATVVSLPRRLHEAA